MQTAFIAWLSLLIGAFFGAVMADSPSDVLAKMYSVAVVVTLLGLIVFGLFKAFV